MLLTSKAVLLILNILFLSIPEELFVIIFSLMLSGRYDLISFSRKNIIKMLVPAALVAVLTNVLRGVAGLNMNFMPFIGLISLFLPMVPVYNLRRLRDILRCLLSLVGSFIVLGLLQLTFVPIILYGTDITIEDLNKPGLVTFISSLPERLLECSVVILMLIKKRSLLHIVPVRMVMKSRALMASSLAVLLINLIYVYILTKSIYVDKILLTLPVKMQILVVAAVFGFPIANITAFITAVHAFVLKEKRKDRYIYDETRILRILVKMLIRDEKYTEIDRQLKSFEDQIRPANYLERRPL